MQQTSFAIGLLTLNDTRSSHHSAPLGRRHQARQIGSQSSDQFKTRHKHATSAFAAAPDHQSEFFGVRIQRWQPSAAPEPPVATFAPAHATSIAPMTTDTLEDSVPNAPLHVTSSDEFDSLIQTTAEDRRVIVAKFYSRACRSCKNFARKFERLAGEFEDVSFVKVDGNEVPELPYRFRVTHLPTFVYIKDGLVVDKYTGTDGERLRADLEAYRDPEYVPHPALPDAIPPPIWP